MPIIFDSVVSVRVDGQDEDLVIHRDSNGKIIAYHSPLTRFYVKCQICEDGARVYIS